MKTRRPETFREQISITQQHLAEYLGISRSLLSLYEKGLRNLPASADIKLSKLQLSYLQLQQAKTKTKADSLYPYLQKDHDKTKKEIKNHAAICSYKKQLAERQLNSMGKEYEKAIALLGLLDVVSSTTPKNKKSGIDHLWIEVQKNEALKKLVRHGSAAQAKLEAKIQTLNAEAAIYDKVHKRM